MGVSCTVFVLVVYYATIICDFFHSLLCVCFNKQDKKFHRNIQNEYDMEGDGAWTTTYLIRFENVIVLEL